MCSVFERITLYFRSLVMGPLEHHSNTGTECADVLRNAAKAHGSLARDAASGEGID